MTEPHVRLSNSRRQEFPAADLMKLTMVQLLSAFINEATFHSGESNVWSAFIGERILSFRSLAKQRSRKKSTEF